MKVTENIIFDLHLRFKLNMASTTSDLTLLGRKLGALDYDPGVYVREIARRSVGGHELLQQRNNIKVCILISNIKLLFFLIRENDVSFFRLCQKAPTLN